MGQLFTDDDLDAESSSRPVDEEIGYKRTTPYAISCVIVGALAVCGLATVQDVGVIGYVTLPSMGILLGLKAFHAIKRYDEAGSKSTKIGMALCAVCLAAAWPLKYWLDDIEVPDQYQRVSYELLQDDDADGPIPKTANELNGKRVFIKGFVYPGRETTGIKEFLLCRDNGSCCFGGKPKLNDMIQVTLKEPLRLDYDTTMRGVGGTFKVEPTLSKEGVGQVLYHLEADYLK